MEDNPTMPLRAEASEGTEPSCPPKFNVPTQMDYSKGCEFTPLDGSQVFREVITDTYVTASNNEDEMVKRIDDAMHILGGKRRGFAGYLSFSYLQMTLFYIMGNYELCLRALDNALEGVEAVEKYIFTRKYDGVSARGLDFVNYAFGESDEELKQTVRYLHDSWNVAKMVHAKAASFESGFSLLVTELMLHAYNKQFGLMRKDCDGLRELLEHLRKFLETERDSEMASAASGGTEFVSIEDIPAETPTRRQEGGES